MISKCRYVKEYAVTTDKQDFYGNYIHRSPKCLASKIQRNVNVMQRIFYFADIHICKKPLPLHLLREMFEWIKSDPLSSFKSNTKSLFMPTPKNINLHMIQH